MTKAECLQAIRDSGVVAVIRASGPEELLQITRALSKGGVRALEITMTSPGALETIKAAVDELQGEAIIGVGSVLDAETARMAILAGAEFVVSLPKPELVRCASGTAKSASRCFTPTNLDAWEAGAGVINLPCNQLGRIR